MKILISLVLLLSLVSCASKQKFLDASAVSMTHNSFSQGTKFKEMGPVAGGFCADSFKDKGEFGLMDEAIKDAQKKSGADVIVDASFFMEGSCVTVEGTGKTVMR